MGLEHAARVADSHGRARCGGGDGRPRGSDAVSRVQARYRLHQRPIPSRPVQGGGDGWPPRDAQIPPRHAGDARRSVRGVRGGEEGADQCVRVPGLAGALRRLRAGAARCRRRRPARLHAVDVSQAEDREAAAQAGGRHRSKTGPRKRRLLGLLGSQQPKLGEDHGRTAHLQGGSRERPARPPQAPDRVRPRLATQG